MRENNFAFIDIQNVHRGIERLGWKIDWKRFRIYLKEKYSITVAYVFIGYIPYNARLYASLQRAGFILVFKPVLHGNQGEIKGNVDSDLVLRAMIEYESYSQAVVISSDGDYYSLVQHLYASNKLACVMSPNRKECSLLLKKTAKERIVFIDTLRHKIEYKRKGTA